MKVSFLVFFLLIFTNLQPTISFTNVLRKNAKNNLLNLVTSGAPNRDIIKALEKVEFLSLGGATLKNPLLSGNWLMVWTTSESIAGKSRPSYLQTTTPPEQLIDIENGRAVNSEMVLGIRNMVKASITPETMNKVKVSFEEFKIGPIGFKAPNYLKGELSVSYLDEEMRISRGDKGNLFILLREATEREMANEVWDSWRKSWDLKKKD